MFIKVKIKKRVWGKSKCKELKATQNGETALYVQHRAGWVVVDVIVKSFAVVL